LIKIAFFLALKVLKEEKILQQMSKLKQFGILSLILTIKKGNSLPGDVLDNAMPIFGEVIIPVMLQPNVFKF
jgi:hypothetical protein